MIRSLDLGVRVLQWRDDDGAWRLVDADQLAAERAGAFTPGPDDWATAVPGAGISAGQTYVCGQVIDGLPDQVTVGGEEVPVHVLGGVWAATWRAWRQRIVVHLNGSEAVLDMERRPHYLAPQPDEPGLHDQPPLGWVRFREGQRRSDTNEPS